MNFQSARRWIRLLIGLAHVLLAFFSGLFLYVEGYKEIAGQKALEMRVEYFMLMYLTGFFFALVAERTNSFGSYHSVKNSIRTAPIWSAIFILFPIEIFLMTWQWESSISAVLFAVLLLFSFFSGCAARIFYNLFFSDFSLRESKVFDSVSLSKFEDDFIQWINSEGPAVSLNEDLFGFDRRVRKVCRFLDDNPGSNLAVLGRFGTGKSSFVNFLEESLSSSERGVRAGVGSIFVRVDGWGLAKGRVSEVIIRQSMSRVSNYIDVSSVSNISQSYRISKGIMRHPVADFFASIFWTDDCVESNFSSLNDILVASKNCLFIVLEDIDRNPDTMVFHQEVPALVERVKKYKNICFILVMGSKSIHFETLVRICDHQEILG